MSESTYERVRQWVAENDVFYLLRYHEPLMYHTRHCTVCSSEEFGPGVTIGYLYHIRFQSTPFDWSRGLVFCSDCWKHFCIAARGLAPPDTEYFVGTYVEFRSHLICQQILSL